MGKQDGQSEKQTLGDELKGNLSAGYRRLKNWVRPSKDHPLYLQVVIFILKLPVLLLLLALTPVFIVVMLLIFIITL